MSESTHDDILRVESELYSQKKSELLGEHANRYVLIKGSEIVGIFDTKTDGIREGYSRFGNVPFLVKHIVEIEPAQNFTSALILA